MSQEQQAQASGGLFGKGAKWAIGLGVALLPLMGGAVGFVAQGAGQVAAFELRLERVEARAETTQTNLALHEKRRGHAGLEEALAAQSKTIEAIREELDRAIELARQVGLLTEKVGSMTGQVQRLINRLDRLYEYQLEASHMPAATRRSTP